MKRLLLALVLLLTLSIGVSLRAPQTSAHTYTTSGPIYCWKFVPGTYYARQDFYVWQDNWWGSGHYLAYSYTQQYGRCYIS